MDVDDVRAASVFLFLTEQCNLSCAHCYVDAGPAKSSYMSEAVMDRAVSIFAQELGVRDFRLTGGEPTLHPMFRSLACRLKLLGCRVRFVSNGTVMLRHQRANAFLSNTDECWISLYGTTPARHLATAGKGALEFDDVLEEVQAIALTGYPIGVSVLLTPGDEALVIDCLDAFAHGGVRRVRFIPAQPDGRAHQPEWSWSGWRHEVQRIHEAVSSYENRNYFQVLRINNPFNLRLSHSTSCSSCLLTTRALWSIAPNGDTFSCCFNVYDASQRVGNVKDYAFAAALRSVVAPCRALQPTYWSQTEPNSFIPTCPISAVDLR